MANVSNDPEEARIGKDLGSRQFVADDSILNDYFDGLEIDADWYDDHPYDTRVAPSMTLSSVDSIFPGGGFKNAFGNLWMRQQWTMNSPITPGGRYQANSRVVDIYEHRNRTLVNTEVVLWSSDGKAMAVGNHHQSYLLSQSSGKVALRDPRAKGGARRFSIPKGDTSSRAIRIPDQPRDVRHILPRQRQLPHRQARRRRARLRGSRRGRPHDHVLRRRSHGSQLWQRLVRGRCPGHQVYQHSLARRRRDAQRRHNRRGRPTTAQDAPTALSGWRKKTVPW